MRGIKGLKSPPLLDVPAESQDRWMIPTEDDKEIILKLFNESRKKGEGWRTAQLAYALAKFGEPQTLSEQDRKAFLKDLNGGRKGFGQAIAQMHVWMRGVGFHEPVTKKDVKEMATYVVFSRVEVRDVLLRSHQLYLMSKLGLTGYMIKSDEADMRDKLSEVSTIKDARGGELILQMHCFMKHLGVKETITDEDKGWMRKRLQEYRSGKKAQDLAEMLLFLQELFPRQEGADTPSLPPVKMFVR